MLCLFGAACLALSAGTVNAFNNFALDIKATLGVNDAHITLLTGLGLVGLQFTFPAGLAVRKASSCSRLRHTLCLNARKKSNTVSLSLFLSR
jgi:hypothetical protein